MLATFDIDNETFFFLSEIVRPICLPPRKSATTPPLTGGAVVAGWGLTEHSETHIFFILPEDGRVLADFTLFRRDCL